MKFTYNLSMMNSGKRTLINPTAPTWFSMLHILEFPSVDPSVIVYAYSQMPIKRVGPNKRVGWGKKLKILGE